MMEDYPDGSPFEDYYDFYAVIISPSYFHWIERDELDYAVIQATPKTSVYVGYAEQHDACHVLPSNWTAAY